MEVLDLIHHPMFFTANSLGHQPMTSHYFQLLTPQTWTLTAAAIPLTLSEYSSWNKATGMSCRDKYWATFCPSPAIHLPPEATALISHKLVVSLIHPPAVQLREDRRSSICVGAPQPRLTLIYCITHSIPTCAPWTRLPLLYWIQHSVPHTPLTFRHSSASFGAP